MIFTWKIGGEAGQGQQAAGLIFSRTCLKQGFFVFNYLEYPSRLRGGLVVSQATISNQPVQAAFQKIDLLFALSQEALDENIKNLNKTAWLIFDSDKVNPAPQVYTRDSLWCGVKAAKKSGVKFIPVAFKDLIRQAGLNPQTANSLILGISFALLKGDLDILKKEIGKFFNGKNKSIAKENQKAAELGWDYAEKNLAGEIGFELKKGSASAKNKIILTANEAVALGTIAAHCQFYSAYPMTPASSVLHYLAKWADKAKMLVNHTEDEISAINMAIGASWAGARAMAGTSGGGFALMVEGLSLAGMIETPLVVLVSQRPAPATGLPTWTEQGDLAFLSKAGHGDFPRIILAPSSSEEAFYFTSLAFNLADIYQTPVFILLDKYLSESPQVSHLDLNKIKINRGKILTEKQLAKIKDFKRYLLTKDGISPRSLPGQDKGMFLANSDEHDEYGFSIEGYQEEMREEQVRKRQIKLRSALKDLPKPQWFGPKNAKTILVGWGSVKGPVIEALKITDKKDVAYCHLPVPYPINPSIKKIFKDKKMFIIENNYTGQLANLLQEALGQEFSQRINKYNGRQFYPEEIVEKLR